MKIKFFTLLALVALNLYGQDCETITEQKTEDVIEKISTPVPKGLEDSVIYVKDKNGKEYVFKIEDYKVVPRNHQSKITKTKVTEKLMCENKNTVFIGAKKGHTGLNTAVSADGKTATVSEERDAVLDINYMRRKLIGPVGVGAGIDTNGEVKGLIGIDF